MTYGSKRFVGGFIEIESCDVAELFHGHQMKIEAGPDFLPSSEPLLPVSLSPGNTHGSQGRIGNTHPSQAAPGRFAHGQRMASRPARLPMLSTAFALLVHQLFESDLAAMV